MIDYVDIAKFFILKDYEYGIDRIDEINIQKLLYSSHAVHLALSNKPLVEGEFQAWRCGPVYPPLYKFYTQFVMGQLPLPTPDEIERIESPVRLLLEIIWDYIGKHHLYKLNTLDPKDFPWRKARKGLLSNIGSFNPISVEDIKTLGKQICQQIKELNEIEEKSVITDLIQKEFSQETKTEASLLNILKDSL